MLSNERRVIELEFFHRIFHLRVFVGLDGKYSREDIGSDPLKSFDRIFGLYWSSKYCITDASLGDRLEPRHYISDLSRVEDISG